MGNGSASFIENNETDSTILALLSIEGTGMSVGAILLAITIVHIIFFNSLSDKFMNIQLQVRLIAEGSFQYRIKMTCCLDLIKFITEDTMAKPPL
jgi:hypothetical protein